MHTHTHIVFLVSHLSLPMHFALVLQEAPFAQTTMGTAGVVQYGSPEKREWQAKCGSTAFLAVQTSL